MSLKRIEEAKALVQKFGGRQVDEATFGRYRRLFVEMWRSPVLDPLRPGDARDTFNGKLAALRFVAVFWLTRLSNRCYLAAERQDLVSATRWSKILKRALERLSPALDLDPLPRPDQSRFDIPSRWQAQTGDKPKRAVSSKRQLLRKLPRNWLEQVWLTAHQGPFTRTHIAVMTLVPLRVEEFVPREFPWGHSPGVVITLHDLDRIFIEINCAKWSRKEALPVHVSFLLDVREAGPAAQFLYGQALISDGRIVLSLGNKNKFMREVVALGEATFPELDENISSSTYRHQLIADLKKTFGGGALVAAGAGQRTDRTQAKYGRVCHGKRRMGIVEIRCSAEPREGNVARAYALANRTPTSAILEDSGGRR